MPPARTAQGHQPQITPRLAVRHKGHRKPPAFNLQDTPELCHCRRQDRVVASGPMAAFRRSPSHAEGGMFMLPPKPDRADPYGHAPPDVAHDARPNRLDRLRQALPSPHPTRRTEQAWSSADRIRNWQPFSAERCGRRGAAQAPRAKELTILYPEPLVLLHDRSKGLCLPSPWERKEPRMWRCDSVGVAVPGVVSLKTRGFPVTVEFGQDAPDRRRLAAEVRHRAIRQRSTTVPLPGEQAETGADNP